MEALLQKICCTIELGGLSSPLPVKTQKSSTTGDGLIQVSADQLHLHPATALLQLQGVISDAAGSLVQSKIDFTQILSVVRSADGVNGVGIITLKSGQKLVIKPAEASAKGEVFVSHFLSKLFPHTPKATLLTSQEVQSFIDNTKATCPDFFVKVSPNGHYTYNYEHSSMQGAVGTSGWILMDFVESARTLQDFSRTELTPFPTDAKFYKDFGGILACDALLRNRDKTSLISILECPNKRTDWSFNAGNVLFKMTPERTYLGMASIDTTVGLPNSEETYASSLINFIKSLKELLLSDADMDPPPPPPRPLAKKPPLPTEHTSVLSESPPPRPVASKPLHLVPSDLDEPPPIIPREILYDPKSLTKEYVNHFLHNLFKLDGDSDVNVMKNPLIKEFAEGFLEMAKKLCKETEGIIDAIVIDPPNANFVKVGQDTILGDGGTLNSLKKAMAQ
jgi:hypothetical protein